ncbi:hypothetical protein [Flavobacterium aquicola]|uniref:Uncharacterized protein n=1 Tax=Flavobacterium aquicola TaxID=1682742 RepID=A0A3E0ECY6_9FLAO|nr:hypothetical protein [Flavobacterium aquicola]REG96138.1 hypothetical protein C8P67_111111 [Flavobacterium aquicola]
MKTMKLIIIGLFLSVSSAQAQVSVNVNIGTPPPVVVASPRVVVASPPEWGPVGYDNMEYYYLPDIQMYYDIRLAQYIYFGGGKWIRSQRLPSHYRNYNLYNGYKVVLTDYHGNAPYVYFNSHKVKYYKGYKGKPQKNRRDYYSHNDYHRNHDNGNHDHDDHHDHHDNGNHGGKEHGKGKHK